MGLMLETSSDRLSERGGPHFGSPDKVPAVRLRTIEDAGRLAIPFTTGILVGIGETLARARRVPARDPRAASALPPRPGGHRPELPGQAAGPRCTPRPSPGDEEFLAAVATARVVLGPRMHVQAPPNLSDPAQQPRLLDAGIDDWGGVSPAHPGPREPRAPMARDRGPRGARPPSAALELRERLTIYPEFALRPDPCLAGQDAGAGRRARGPDGLAVAGKRPEPIPWQDPEVAWKPRDDRPHVREGRRAPGFAATPRSSTGTRGVAASRGRGRPSASPPARLDAEIRSARSPRRRRTVPITDERGPRAVPGRGRGLEALCAVADDLRREAVGDDVTYVVNRNINFTNVCYVGCRFCAFAQREVDAETYTLTLDEVAERAREAGAWGAHRGVHAGRHPPRSAGVLLLRPARRREGRRAGYPHPRLQPDGGAERRHEARDLVPEFLPECRRHGLGTIPGTAAEILDDDVRWVLTKGKLPADTWEEIVRTAHGLGIRSSSTIMYGHVDAPPHWVFHIRRLARIQRDTGGFTEFVPLPVRPPERADLPRGQGATGSDLRREPADARRRADPARRSYPQRSGLVGEDGRRSVRRRS